jgi:hypothetical protein
MAQNISAFIVCCLLAFVLWGTVDVPNRSVSAFRKWPYFFQFGFLLWGSYWLLLWPSPGKGVVALGVAAGIMALQADMKWYHRVVWIFILSLFAFIEIMSIDKDREAHEAEFGTITAELAQTIRQSNTIMREANTLLATTNRVEQLTASNLQNITGGDEFCYVYAAWNPLANRDQNIWELVLGNSGDVMLPTCTMRVVENIQPGDDSQEAERKFFMPSINERNVPPKKQGAHFINYFLKLGQHPKQGFQFIISTPTQQFFETIDFTLDGKTNMYTDSCLLRRFSSIGPVLKRGCIQLK